MSRTNGNFKPRAFIVSQAPVRIPLGGGGTDLPSFYQKEGGFVLTAAINLYVRISVNKREDDSGIHYMYSDVARFVDPDDFEKIEHGRIRETLRFCGIKDSIEIASMSDVSTSSGLGTSSSATVAMLAAFHAYNGLGFTKQDIAEEACQIEINKLGEPIGKQDQYIATYGGIQCLHIDRNGQVAVEPLAVSRHVIAELQNRLLLFWTGKQRNASDILRVQDQATKSNHDQTVKSLVEIKAIGFKIQQALETEDLDEFGRLMDEHWQTKKRLSTRISDGHIDQWYDLARKSGALGGKIMGAGGGGFFLFYVPEGARKAVRETLNKAGLKERLWNFDWEGVKVVLDISST